MIQSPRPTLMLLSRRRLMFPTSRRDPVTRRRGRTMAVDHRTGRCPRGIRSHRPDTLHHRRERVLSGPFARSYIYGADRRARLRVCNASNRVCECGERPSSRGPRRTVRDPRTCVDDNVHGHDNCCKFRSSLDSAHETRRFLSKISHSIYVFELYLHVETPSISCTRNCVHPGFGFHTGTAMSGVAQPKRASNRALRVRKFRHENRTE